MKIINQNKLDNFLKNYSISDTIFVLDFDGTITLEGYNSFAVLQYENTKMQKYFDTLFQYYWPIERASKFGDIQSNLSKNDLLLSQTGINFDDFRDIMMQQWWDHTMLIAVKFRTSFKNLEVEKMKMRGGMGNFLLTLLDKNYSLLIASAGVHNFIEQFFRYHNFDTRKMNIVANEFLLDDDQRAIGYNKKLITPFTKQHIDYTEYNLGKKKYAIQIGDSLGDAHIVNDHFEEENLLSIGFSHGQPYRQESFE
ncbi:hypothetical protein LR004_01610, partial [Candidatus Gracilibacteria bacterium]|nr:hypothetical protein [Candidatus Gracilibacteria bacterium]